VSFWRNTVRTQDRLKQMTQHYRTVGYDDGYAGRPAKSKQVDYAQGWKRGQEARRAEGELG
jgi:hypothetical protein